MQNAIEKIPSAIDHFKSSVPDAVALKMYVLASLIHEDYISEQGESYGTKQLSEISGIGYDGYIPFQDGGFEVTDMYPSTPWTTTFNAAHEEFLNKESDRCLENYMHELMRQGRRADDLPVDATYEDLTEKQKEEYGDYENEWFEPALLRFATWISMDTKWGNEAKEVNFRLTLGYSDGPYYRDSKDDDTLYESSMSIEDFIKVDINELATTIFKEV